MRQKGPAPARALVTRIPDASLPGPTRQIGQEIAGVFKGWFETLAPETRRAYARDFQEFAAFVGAADPGQAASLLFSKTHGEANALVFQYAAELKAKDLAPATISRRLASLKALNRLVRTFGLVPWTLERPRGVKVTKYRDTFGPGAAAVEGVLKDLDGKADPISSRNLAILALLFEHGLRRHEVSSIDLEHFDRPNRRLWLKRKARAERKAYVPSDRVLRALERWLAVRGSAPGPLFTALDRGHAGGRLSDTSIYRIIRGYGLKRPHGVRHSAITHVAEVTKDVRMAQQFADHGSITTTQVYFDNLKDLHAEAVDQVFNKKPPKP